jgi:hypothetical protein
MKNIGEALCPQVTQPMKDYWKTKCVVSHWFFEKRWRLWMVLSTKMGGGVR